MKKVRLTLIAAAVLLSVGGAYATKVNHNTKDVNTYGVVSEDASNYYVSLQSGTCDQSTNDCEITTMDTPDQGNNNAIPKDDASVTATGTFQAH